MPEMSACSDILQMTGVTLSNEPWARPREQINDNVVNKLANQSGLFLIRCERRRAGGVCQALLAMF